MHRLVIAGVLGLILAGEALAQRVIVTKTTATRTGYPTSTVELTMTQADVTNDHTFTFAGDKKEVIIAQNVGTTWENITFSSIADSKTGRTGDVTVSLTPSSIVIFGPLALDGWRQTTGNMHLEAASANVSFAVITIP